jgi:CheY-like chemotaxis protein
VSRPVARVLFADDDQLLQRLMDVNFRLAGIEMEGVGRGDDALARLIEAPPDALILDATMPGIDGHEVFRRLRTQPSLGTLPVIFLTGRSADEFAAYGDLPHVQVVTKPFDPDDLVRLVREAIEARA